MPAALLATKLYLPPPRSGWVPRPRLVERLTAGLVGGARLSLISAPAGFGKTTLVSEWIENCRLRNEDFKWIDRQSAIHDQQSEIIHPQFCWLSLDEGDQDPVRFLTYFIAALQTIANELGKGALALLQSPQPPPMEALLTVLLNEMTAFPGPFLLVLDDYHVIDSEPVDQALDFLIEHQPSQMHLVIATREDPALPLARLRARGLLTELRATDLRFTPAEAAEFLNRVMGLNLSSEDLAALETRTEGWIAGLQLAALSTRGREDVHGFIRSFAGDNRYIVDYLVEEVLRRQPEPVRSFLLQTAILDRLCGPLCDAVTGQADSSARLEALQKGNFFVVPLDDRRQWYRYHQLFADVLQAHGLESQPDQVATLHGRASAWYEQNGLRPDAIRHALAAKDFERAAGLIELAWPAAEEGNIQPAAWLSWIKTLPEALVHVRPVLTLGYAYALLGRGELEAAEARLQDAERWLEPPGPMQVQPETPSGETRPESIRRMVITDPEQWKSLPAAIAIGRTYIAQALGNIPDTVRYASRALEFPEADPFRHSQAAMLLGMAYWATGDLEAAGRVFAEYTLKLRAEGNIRDAISSTVVLADIRLALGRLHEAIRAIEQCLQFVMDQGEPIPCETADLHRGLSELYLEQGDLKAAAQLLQKSIELGGKAELPVWRYRWYIARARLNETQADLDEALSLLDEAERLYIRTPLPIFHPIPAMKARLWVAQGRLAEALEWVSEQGLSPGDDLCYLREFEHITLARILIAQFQNNRMDGTIRAAMRLLDRLLQAAEEGSRISSVIEILVLQALAYKAQGSLTPALAPLQRALALAEPEGYMRIFVVEGEPMRLLIEDFRFSIEKQNSSSAHAQLGYIGKLLAAFTPPVHKPSTIRNQQSTMLEPLSERELEVLRLLRTDLNGPDIARELVVSLSTLRTHTQNIYAKLGVNNRRAAVRRAEELDLI